MWAPVFGELPLGPCSNRQGYSPALHFSPLSSKLYVSPSQVRKNLCTQMLVPLVSFRNDMIADKINTGDCPSIASHWDAAAPGGQETQPVRLVCRPQKYYSTWFLIFTQRDRVTGDLNHESVVVSTSPHDHTTPKSWYKQDYGRGEIPASLPVPLPVVGWPLGTEAWKSWSAGSFVIKKKMDAYSLRH
jgi:hypothetical protein